MRRIFQNSGKSRLFEQRLASQALRVAVFPECFLKNSAHLQLLISETGTKNGEGGTADTKKAEG